MTTALLNIGLDNPAELHGIAQAALHSDLQVLNFQLAGESVVLGVAHHSIEWSLLDSVAELCDSLGRDCIAVYDPVVGGGYLIGPRLSGYGEFDPAKFVLLDGSTLQ